MILSMFAPAEHQGGLLPHGLSPTVYCTMQAICPVHSVEEKVRACNVNCFRCAVLV